MRLTAEVIVRDDKASIRIKDGPYLVGYFATVAEVEHRGLSAQITEIKGATLPSTTTQSEKRSAR